MLFVGLLGPMERAAMCGMLTLDYNHLAPYFFRRNTGHLESADYGSHPQLLGDLYRTPPVPPLGLTLDSADIRPMIETMARISVMCTGIRLD